MQEGAERGEGSIHPAPKMVRKRKNDNGLLGGLLKKTGVRDLWRFYWKTKRRVSWSDREGRKRQAK